MVVNIYILFLYFEMLNLTYTENCCSVVLIKEYLSTPAGISQHDETNHPIDLFTSETTMCNSRQCDKKMIEIYSDRSSQQ